MNEYNINNADVCARRRGSQFKEVQALLFDYGGTLDVPARHWANVLWEAYCALGVSVDVNYFRDAYVFGERFLGRNYVIEPTDNFLQLLRKKVRLELNYLQSNRLWRVSPLEFETAIEGIAQYCNGKVEDGLKSTCELLGKLKEHYRLVIVSNFYGNLQTVLSCYGLLPFFHAVVESAVVGVRKPSPQIWKLGADAAGYDPDKCLAIGDSLSKDVEPAAELGCPTIWLHGESWSPERPTNVVPRAEIQSLSELSELLL